MYKVAFSVFIKNFIMLYVFITTSNKIIFAQHNSINQDVQYWFGYLTSIRVHEKYSIWNDFHFVPNTFFLSRHGIGYHLTNQVIFTAGYAWLRLPLGSDQILLRKEHRPWAQINYQAPKLGVFTINNRIRYDYRIRQDIYNKTELLNSYTANHRVRYMASVRFPMWGCKIGSNVPFVSVNNEILINFGSSIVWNYFDQNRTWINVGYQYKNLTIQLGYMLRYVQLGKPEQKALYHTPLIWITHVFDFRKKTRIGDDENLIIREQ
jgi:hypothetical protein